MSENSDIPKEKLEEYRQAFNIFDVNHDGVIDNEELGKLVKVLMPGNKHPEAAANRILTKHDLNHNGVIEFDEFLDMMTKVDVTEDDLKIRFDEVDADKDGRITRKELAMVLVNFGLEVKEEELDEMIKDVKFEKDGTLNYEEFKKLMV